MDLLYYKTVNIYNEEINERMGWELFPKAGGGVLETYMQNPTGTFVKIHQVRAHLFM